MKTFSLLSSKYVLEALTALMILLLVYTGLSKLLANQSFSQQLSAAPYISHYSHWMSWFIPLVELTITALLIINKTRLEGYFAFLFMMSMFTIYIILALAGGKQLPCSCGGVIQQLSWPQHILFNTCFILAGILSIKLYYGIRNSK